jgi:preprotein translocase subunit SecG
LFGILLVFHIVLSLILIVSILLQSGKGGGLAAAFGGGGPSETVFGGRSAATFLTKLTTVVGILFFLTSFTLAILSKQGDKPSSLIQRENRGTVEPQPYLPSTIPLEEEGNQQTPPAEAGEQPAESE